MKPGDSGHLYFELKASGQNLVEGGLEYYSDFPNLGQGGMAPYLRDSAYYRRGGYVTLTNGSARYGADTNLGIFHGVTLATLPPPNNSSHYTYTAVGEIPSSIDPQTEWVNQQIVYLNNAAWLFGLAPPDVMGGGIDNAGHETACALCSISQVTSIAQDAQNLYDGSYFGVYFGQNAANWLQVGFGNWGSNCQPGTNLCTFYVASDPYRYYGGPQYYPDAFVSQSDFGPTGYGPYETFDGISLAGNNNQRPALRQFTEPLPPLPCTLDGSGYCADQTLHQINDTVDCTKIVNHQPIPETLPDKWTDYFGVYAGRSFVQLDNAVTAVTISPSCIRSNQQTTWPQGEPKNQYHDPNLP